MARSHYIAMLIIMKGPGTSFHSPALSQNMFEMLLIQQTSI